MPKTIGTGRFGKWLENNNEKINWVPKTIGTGRFGKWLENNIDWSLSRERYWGCPLPIWENEDGDKICVGSVAELGRLAGRDLSELDLHRPYVDEITFERDGKTYRRVPYTIDVWFESGAMPYAQWHYPFENEKEFLANFPADFICEALDQTRGWFYTLHAIAALLTDTGGEGRAPGPLAGHFPDSPAFKNCVVLGLLTDGAVHGRGDPSWAGRFAGRDGCGISSSKRLAGRRPVKG